MFILSVDTLALIQRVDDLTKELHQALDQLGDLIERDTEGALSVCSGLYSGPTQIQLYDLAQNGRGVTKLLERYLPANHELTVKWETEESICYSFSMYGRQFAIVVDK